ncbi:restriction endonuclease subunit S, partial [Frisingicoccus sp.]|uniref:restriction endonuclease subunit S n=1 Tax=Frisingicoccus sp. TaxID=1918627 RepID=UPI003735FD73
MSRLTELIQEYCPDGVEYKPFGEMATIVRGASPRPIKNFVTTEPEGVNWIKIGDVKPGSKYITKTAEKITLDGAKKSRFVKEGDFILSNSMSFGRPYIMKTQGCIHDGWLAISNFDNSFVPDFLYHLLNSNMYQQIMKQKASFGGAVQNLNADIVKELDMPVVPLEVQCEIVRILDNFTELTKELKAELTAELTARKKQYEYYRDNLLTFDSTIKQVRLGEICSVITKGTTPKSYTKTGISFVKTEAFDGTRIVPERLSYVDEETHTNFLRRSILEENDILVTIAGATIGKCAMVPKEILPANTNQALAIIRLAKGNSPKYVMYLLQSDLMKQYMQKKIKGSAQPQ